MSWLDTMASNAGINKDYTQHEQDTATNSANGEKSLYDKKLLNIGPFNFSGKEIMDASQSLLDSAASVYGNIAYEFGNPYGIGDTLRNYAQQHEQAMGENTQPGFNYDYIMNGGLLRDTGTLAGSVLSLAPVGAVAAGGAAALGASAPVVGAVGGIASALGEAAAEGGGTLADSLAQGLSLDEAESRAREVTGKNALFLGATNALSGGMMGNFLKGVARNIAGKGASELADGIASQSGLISQGTKETLKGAGTLGLSALNEGFQEAEQDAISASVDPNKYASYNPVYWSDEQWEDFNRTIGPTALMGLLGGAGGNASYNAGLARQNEMQETEHPSNPANDMTNATATSIPAQANYTIADEVSDANLSQGTESKLRMLDEAYYKQYGQHLYVTSMTRHWGTNSDHETGSAFDVADDGLANDSERRQWIAEKARQLGLNPLDEYENPSIGATGGHMHFSDKGGAVNVDTSGWSGNADIDSLINENANKYGVDAALLAAIAEQESGFNQEAQSEAGALGIMQLMPPTAEGLGVDATDLAGNIEGGAKYIRQMLDQFGGDVHKALEAYNGGPGGVGTAQTVKYADEVMQRYEKFKTKSAGTFSWSNPAEAKTSPTDYMKIMSDNNVTADTAGDFLQYVQLLAEDDANANNEQVQKDGAKAVKAIADGSPDVMERVAKELGYGQVKQEAEQKAPNIPMPKIKHHVQQNGWVEIGNKKDADEFARTDYGKTLERVSNTKFVSPDFNAITGRVEQRPAQPQQVAQSAPKPTVQNTVREDTATKEDTATAEANSLRTSLPGSASALARILSQNPAAISYNGNNVDLNKLNNAIKNNDIETVNGFNAHMMKNMSRNGVPLDSVMQEYLPVAKDMAGRLSKIPEAVHGANGTSVDLRALQEAVSNNDLNRITAFNEKMSENLQSNGMSPYLALREVEADTAANTQESKNTEYDNKSNTNTTNESVSKPQERLPEGKSSQQEAMPPQKASDGENAISLKNIKMNQFHIRKRGLTDRDLQEAEKMGISFTSKERLLDGKPVYDIEFASQEDADKFVREFFGEVEDGDVTQEIKAAEKENAKENEIDENIKNGKKESIPQSGENLNTVVTDDGKEFKVAYKVMPAEDVVASNLPTDGLPVNKDYPSAMQPRNRQRVAMQEQITSMSNNLRPADLAESRNLNQGAPVIKSDGTVLNGNGRTIAIQRAWLNGKADKYKQYLLDNAEKLGINPADIESIEHPILVRVVQDKLSKDDIMSMINSTTGGQRMSPSEQAKVDSGKIKSSTLNQYVAGSDLTSAANRNFLRDVLADIISPSERNAYYSREGAINQDGVLRAQRALFALAYGDDTLLDAFSEAVNEEAKNFSNALKANAPLIARLQQLIKTGNATDLGLQKNLVSAVKALKEAVIAGKPAKSIWQEMSMFEDTEHSPETIAIARAMDGYRRSGKKLTQFVRNLAELGLKHGNPNQTGLLGEEAAPRVKLTDDIATAKEYVDTGNQMDMFAPKYSRSAFSFANPDTAEELKATGNIDTPLDRLPKLPASKLRDSERKMQAFGKAIGVPVHFVNHPDKGYRGVFTHNGEVYINRNATVPAKAIFLHEFTHWLKASGKENRAVFDALAACVERDGGLFHERRLKQYRDRIFGGEQMTDEEIIEEIICNAMGNSKTAERISKAIDNFAPELNQSIWGRIKAMWDKFCQMVGFKQETASKPQKLPNGLSQKEMAQFNSQLNILMSKMRTADGKPMFKVENYQLVVADNNQRPAEMFDINNINDYTPTYNIPAMSNSYSYQVHAQREAVRQQYEGTKEWMKAPNGEPTNLTEEQWLDVRTPNFKAWFGDWENNPDEASKVVDENGEPLVVYHGSESNFDEFDTAKARANMDIQGMFFSPIQEEANDYGENVRAFFLNIKNPADYDTGYNALKNHKGENLAGEKARNDLIENGYDGVNNDGEEYIAFNPNQIKSATENTGAFSPDTNNIKYSRDRAGATPSTSDSIIPNAIRRLASKVHGYFFTPELPNNVTAKERREQQQIGVFEDEFSSPSRIAEHLPKLFGPYIEAGLKAQERQEKLRARFLNDMNEVSKLLGYKKYRRKSAEYKKRLQDFNKVMLAGDLDQCVYTDEELREQGLDENTIKAYHKMRSMLDEAWELVNRTKEQLKFKTERYKNEAVAEADIALKRKSNPFIEVYKKSINDSGELVYTTKEPKVIKVDNVTVTGDELENLKKNNNIYITKEKHISGSNPSDITYSVSYFQKSNGLGKIKGYIPHVFHEWQIMEADKDGNVLHDGENPRIIKTFSSRGDALDAVIKIGDENQDKHFVVLPKIHEVPGASERAAIMGDYDYNKTISKIAHSMKVSTEDAKRIMADTIKKKNKRRFLGYTMKRKGVKGYEDNVMLATYMYLNQASRYVALDPFKQNCINMYNRTFGSFDDASLLDRSPNASFIRDYMNDVNGVPSRVEIKLNRLFNKLPFMKSVAGGRSSIWFFNTFFTYPMTIMKLGILNPSSALLNLTQLFNLFGAMGENVMSKEAYERLIKKGFIDARKCITNKNSELGKLLWNDLGLEAQIGADIAGGYSSAELSGVAALSNGIGRLAGDSMYLFRLSDTYTRAVTLLTAYNKALDEGKSKQEAIEYAKRVNRKVNFDYSIADTPRFLRRLGPLGNVIFQFKKYPIKQLELFKDIYDDGRALGLNRKRSYARLLKYMTPYFAMSGFVGGFPFISTIGGVFAFFFMDDDDDWKQVLTQYMFETFGEDNPITLWFLYGAGAFVGMNIGSRVGVGDFLGVESRPKNTMETIMSMTTLTSTGMQAYKQASYGNYAEAVKAINPAVGNVIIGAKGEVRTTRGRMKYQYQNAYEQALRMIGFNPLNETMAGDIASNDYANKQAEKRSKDDAIDAFIEEPTAENAARLNELGVTPKSIQTEMARRKMNRAELNRLAEAEKAEKAKKSKQKKKQYSASDYLTGK